MVIGIVVKCWDYNFLLAISYRKGLGVEHYDGVISKCKSIIFDNHCIIRLLGN